MAKKKSKSSKPKPAKDVPFEESLADLREIVSSLEGGNLTLGQSLEKYEQGIKHLRQCHLALEQAEQKIKVLVSLDANGNLNTKSFDGSASQLDFSQDDSDVEESGDEEEIDEPEIDEEQFYDDTEDIDDSDALF